LGRCCQATARELFGLVSCASANNKSATYSGFLELFKKFLGLVQFLQDFLIALSATNEVHGYLAAIRQLFDVADKSMTPLGWIDLMFVTRSRWFHLRKQIFLSLQVSQYLPQLPNILRVRNFLLVCLFDDRI